jgi:hypothetical protein
LAVFPRFKKEDIVARMEVGKTIKSRVVIVRRFRVQLVVFVCMGEERMQIAEEVTMSAIVS